MGRTETGPRPWSDGSTIGRRTGDLLGRELPEPPAWLRLPPAGPGANPAARPVLAYVARAGIAEDKEGPLFRPLTRDGTGFERRHLDRKTPWRLVKKYCQAAGIDPYAYVPAARQRR